MIVFLYAIFILNICDSNFPPKEYYDFLQQRKTKYLFNYEENYLRQTLYINEIKERKMFVRVITLNYEDKKYTALEGWAKEADSSGAVKEETDECGGTYSIREFELENNGCKLLLKVSILFDRAKIIDKEQCYKKFNENCPLESIATLRRF